MFLLMISFIVALALVLVAMPKVIPYLHKLKFGQVEREEGLLLIRKRVVHLQWVVLYSL